MQGGILYQWADYLLRPQVEMLLRVRLSPLSYLILLLIAFTSMLDVLLLIALKAFNIEITNRYLQAYSGGIFWKDLSLRIGVVWGVVLLDQAVLTSSIRTMLPLAAIISSGFLFSTVCSAIKQQCCNVKEAEG